MELKESIIRTIAFFDLFDHPLTAEEIHEYLYGYPKPVHIKEIKGTLDQLGGSVEHIRDWFVLKGRGRIIDLRKSHKFIAEKFWGRVRQYGQYLAGLPFVEMVAVCNNLAYDNPTEESDIDLFIVIREGRMWLARLLVTLVLQFFGVRRHGNRIAGRFCLSFFVTPKKIGMGELQLDPEDPYLAYWTKLLAPVYGEEMYDRFVDMNKGWLDEKYGIRFSETNRKQIVFRGKGAFKRSTEWLFGNRIGNTLESWVRKIWMSRTSKKAATLGPEASVVVSDDMLKFHNKDRRKEYRDQWNVRVQKSLADQEAWETEQANTESSSIAPR